MPQGSTHHLFYAQQFYLVCGEGPRIMALPSIITRYGLGWWGWWPATTFLNNFCYKKQYDHFENPKFPSKGDILMRWQFFLESSWSWPDFAYRKNFKLSPLSLSSWRKSTKTLTTSIFLIQTRIGVSFALLESGKWELWSDVKLNRYIKELHA